MTTRKLVGAILCAKSWENFLTMKEVGERNLQVAPCERALFLNATILTGWSHWESFMVKPNGRLVRVSSRITALPPPAYQSRSLRLAFLGDRSPLGKPYLEASFSLRCFQRLSLPDFATELCHGRDNSITRGLFIPVLSY